MNQTTKRRHSRSSFWLFASLFACACVSRPTERKASSGTPIARQPESTPEVGATIHADRLLDHITLLANDQMEGRGTGSPGIDLAAGYIAGQFAVRGVAPGGDGGSYFQKFIIPSDPRIAPLTQIAIQGRSGRVELKTDFIPLARSAEGDFEGEVVFVGYGLTAADKNHDDYERSDVSGKVALVLRGQPPQLRSDPSPRERVLFEQKIDRAAELGAAAILFVNTAPTGDEKDTLIPFGRRGRSSQIPVFHITRAIGDELLSAAGQKSLSELQEAIDRGEKVPTAPSVVNVSGHVAFEREDWPSRNVIGLVRGNGPHANEFVVIGGHYDHLGVREEEIYNGADDNASGTAGVIEICGTIAQVPNRDRSLLCMAFTGEEIGLLGSEHYVAHPTVAVDSIVAMINMDMIGRWTPGVEANELAIQGLGTGDSFERMVKNRTDQAGIKFVPDASAKGPSDHASFYEADIPSLFFFTGVHSDYHRPGDDVEKINAAGAARIATLVARITQDLLNAPVPPKFDKVDAPARIFRGPQLSSVVMGIVADMDSQSSGPGWPIADVMPGGGADKAGMKPGDRILSVNGQSITGMEDYFKATKEKKPGDVVPVIIIRGSEHLTLQVELEARP